MALIFDFVVYDIILALIVLCISLFLLALSKQSYWKDRGVPYVAPTSVFGEMLAVLLGKKNIFEARKEVYDKLRGHKYGGFFEMNLPTLLVMNPELVEKVLVKDFTYFYDRGFPSNPENDPLSQHLFNLEGEKWRHLRYKLTPTFTTGKLKGMFDQICNCGENLVKDIEKESKMDKAFNPKKIFGRFALDVIASCAFGIKLDGDENSGKQFHQMVASFVKPNLRQMLYFVLYVYVPWFAKLIRIKPTPQELEDFVMKLITDTLKYREENKINRNDFLQVMYNLQKREQNGDDADCLDDDHHDEDDVINQMKHAIRDDNPSQVKQKVVTNACIAAQSFVFLLAGSESISGSIGYILFCLAQHPDVQDKVHSEIDLVLEKFQHKWSYQAVKEMTYLDQVIQETQRLYPASPELMRMCTESYKLPDSDFILEKGTRVIIPVMAIHNDPDNYTSPQVFDPERFANNNFKPSGIFMPFGNGPRICIAMRFALLELKVCLARILAAYTVKLNSKTQLPLKQETNSFLLSPVGGFWFEFHKKS